MALLWPFFRCDPGTGDLPREDPLCLSAHLLRPVVLSTWLQVQIADKHGSNDPGNLTHLWKITMFNGKIHYKGPFSLAMLNYQRVISLDEWCFCRLIDADP